ncbi:quinolinate synthase NadA [Sorangium cellulosum]
MHVWDGECHLHTKIRPRDIARMRATHPNADFYSIPSAAALHP